MDNNKMYECAICGKSYPSIDQRVECETKCLAERKKLEEEMKRNQYNTKRDESAREINKALYDVNEMITEHLKKYTSLSLSDDYPQLRYIFNRSAWWF